MREKILSEFMEALQHCDTVKVVLTGVGESQFKTKDIYLGISKLEKENAKLPDLRRENAELKAINKEMYEALEQMEPLINNSTGIVGYYMNGNVAKWNDFDVTRIIGNALRKARGEKE